MNTHRLTRNWHDADKSLRNFVYGELRSILGKWYELDASASWASWTNADFADFGYKTVGYATENGKAGIYLAFKWHPVFQNYDKYDIVFYVGRCDATSFSLESKCINCRIMSFSGRCQKHLEDGAFAYVDAKSKYVIWRRNILVSPDTGDDGAPLSLSEHGVSRFISGELYRQIHRALEFWIRLFRTKKCPFWLESAKVKRTNYIYSRGF